MVRCVAKGARKGQWSFVADATPYMQFGVPAWNCLNRVLLAQFVVPEGLDIGVVRIYADLDNIDSRTGQSPGMTAA